MVCSYLRLQEPFVVFKCSSLYFEVTVLTMYIHLLTTLITLLFVFLHCLFVIIAEVVKFCGKNYGILKKSGETMSSLTI